MIAFGPVPSRRLGRSLGINNIPPKICTYACVYCQLARPSTLRLEREPFYAPEQIVDEVRDKVGQATERGEGIDYVTFVPDGEPTLDVNLGRELTMLEPLGIPTAVITNGSLIGRRDVREELARADWVSLKVDAASEETWRQVNRPHGRLQLDAIQEGMFAFAAGYEGMLATETMLLRGVNDDGQSVRAIAQIVGQLAPDVAYISIPTRPPSAEWVQSPDEASVNRAYQMISERVERVETLIGYEGNTFAFTGHAEEDLLGITAVHPMREDAVDTFLQRAEAGWSLVDRLLDEDQLVRTDYGGHTFYLRRLDRRKKPAAGR